MLRGIQYVRTLTKRINLTAAETELVARARRGDEEAWVELVGATQEAVFRLAYLLLADAADAEDVAQETFVRAFRSIGRFDIERPLRPWLLSITTNLARNRKRSLGRYFAALRRAYSSVELSTPNGERSEQAWEAQTLWKAVRRLHGAEQEVVYMRYFLEMSEAEMAVALNVAAGTVKSRLHRAIKHLRGVVDNEFPALREERQT